MNTTTHYLKALLPLPAPVDVTDRTGATFMATEVEYGAVLKHDGGVMRTTTLACWASVRTYYQHTDLPDDLPDAPQWFLDAVEAMTADARGGDRS